MATPRRKHVENYPFIPSLSKVNNRIKSKKNANYNCIAYAAGKTNINWWPTYHPDGYWPPGVPVELTLAAFIRAFETLGYSESATKGDFIKGIEKVALYTKDGRRTGEPTHAARQIGKNRWKSKLGRCYDIEHSEDAVSSGSYGGIAAFLERPKKG